MRRPTPSPRKSARSFRNRPPRRPASTNSVMDTNALTTVDSTAIERLQQRGLVVGVAGLVAGAVGVFLRPDQFAPSWLIGFLFCTGLSCGSLALLMLQHMSRGQWGLVTRRIFEAGSRVLPYCILLFIPVAAFAP